MAGGRGTIVAALALATATGCTTARVVEAERSGQIPVPTTTTTVPVEPAIEGEIVEDVVLLDEPADEDLDAAIEAVLIPPEQIGTPWTIEARGVGNRGREWRPNPSDCDEYWAYGSLDVNYHGRTAWVDRDGTSRLSHSVYAVGDTDFATGVLDALTALPFACETVNWVDDDITLVVHPLDTGVSGITSVGFDVGTGREIWIAARAHGSLVSIVQFVDWVDDGAVRDDAWRLFNELVALVAIPGEQDTRSDEDAVGEPEAEPATEAEPDVQHEMFAGLLADGELTTGWTVGEPTISEPVPPSATADCDGPAASTAIADRREVELVFFQTRDAPIGGQHLARFDTSDDAVAAVEALVGTSTCRLPHGQGVYTHSTTDVDVDGASRAIVVEVVDGDGDVRARSIIVAVDHHVSVISLWQQPADWSDILSELGLVAAAKLGQFSD